MTSCSDVIKLDVFHLIPVKLVYCTIALAGSDSGGGVISAVMSSSHRAVACSNDIAIDSRRHVQSVTEICGGTEKTRQTPAMTFLSRCATTRNMLHDMEDEGSSHQGKLPLK